MSTLIHHDKDATTRRWTDSNAPMKSVAMFFYGLIVLLLAIGAASISGYVTTYQHTQAIAATTKTSAANTSTIRQICQWHRLRDQELMGKYAKWVSLNRAYAKELPPGYATALNVLLTSHSNDLAKLENAECALTPPPAVVSENP